MKASFEVGSRVHKVGGSYEATGMVVAAFKTRAGKQRYVFEFDELPGMLHIFNHEQLEPLNMDEQQLRKCPFCGSEAEFEYDEYDFETGDGDDGVGWISCTNSKCGVGFHGEPDSLIQQWNARQ